MNTNEYIASGELELYVAGLLPEKRNREIDALVREYPEIQQEIEEVEKAIRALSSAAAPQNKQEFSDVVRKLILRKVMPARRHSFATYVGWAAAAVFVGIAVMQFVNQTQLSEQLQVVDTERIELNEAVDSLSTDLQDTQLVLEQLRDKSTDVINLSGQEVAPEAYAKVFWNQENQEVYIDAQGLPEPPEGMVYQVWSLQLDPLTPISIGLLDDFADNEALIFTLNNPNTSEAFGITLEPAGGSETPTMEQLHTLGVVQL